jgi:hypothetical protein
MRVRDPEFKPQYYQKNKWNKKINLLFIYLSYKKYSKEVLQDEWKWHKTNLNAHERLKVIVLAVEVSIITGYCSFLLLINAKQ